MVKEALAPQVELPPEMDTIKESYREENFLEISAGKKEIIESAQEERRKILFKTLDYLTNKLPIPILDFSKAAVEAALGKTVSGHKLSPFDRILWSAMSGLIIISYAMMLSERLVGVDLSKPGAILRVAPMVLAAIADWRFWEGKIKEFIKNNPTANGLVSKLSDHLKFWDRDMLALNISQFNQNLTEQVK